ncbi:hypothetical protein AL01_03995 [Bombella intestini]|uniref:DUF1217 domain-containing protein n=1 Tax=Bombella intestini TaxID=1539051 RepID=A0A1S8GQE3_9PROT|nr:DUF1217 domain-containing protein [Bombella intestini]OOL18905.1 hypothetical protein AL01_03995 [Bombella intestini]
MGLSGISPVAQFLMAQKNEVKAAADSVKGDNTAKRMVADFQDKAPSITTADQLMRNYSANQVVLKAYNLSSLGSQQAIEKALLTQDPTSSSSLARTSQNASWLAFADAFSSMGAGHGTASATPFTSDMIATTVSSYEQRQYETSDAQQKDGVGDALYFTRKMQSGTVKTVNDLMADPTLLRVAEVVSGYDPDQFGALDFDQQKRIISNKVDMNSFSKPDAVQRYAERYLTQIQMHPSYNSDDKPASMIDLFGGDDGGDGILALFGGSGDGTSSSGLF